MQAQLGEVGSREVAASDSHLGIVDHLPVPHDYGWNPRVGQAQVCSSQLFELSIIHKELEQRQRAVDDIGRVHHNAQVINGVVRKRSDRNIGFDSIADQFALGLTWNGRLPQISANVDHFNRDFFTIKSDPIEQGCGGGSLNVGRDCKVLVGEWLARVNDDVGNQINTGFSEY